MDLERKIQECQNEIAQLKELKEDYQKQQGLLKEKIWELEILKDSHITTIAVLKQQTLDKEHLEPIKYFLTNLPQIIEIEKEYDIYNTLKYNSRRLNKDLKNNNEYILYIESSREYTQEWKDKEGKMINNIIRDIKEQLDELKKLKKSKTKYISLKKKFKLVFSFVEWSGGPCDDKYRKEEEITFIKCTTIKDWHFYFGDGKVAEYISVLPHILKKKPETSFFKISIKMA